MTVSGASLCPGRRGEAARRGVARAREAGQRAGAACPLGPS